MVLRASLRSGAEVHVQSWSEDEDGADYRHGKEDPQEDPVQHLSHELPVLNHLEEKNNTHTQLFQLNPTDLFFYTQS